jgi:predicted dehydrogenase
MKTALIGLGRMGMRQAVVLRQCGLEISAISDLNRDFCAAFGTEYDVAPENWFLSGEELIEKIRPELLVIATTAPSHRDLVVKAAQSGARKILCEKPMAVSLAQCEEMVGTCRHAGVDLAVNHQMRLMEQYTLPKYMAASPEFGGIGSVVVSAGNFGMAMNGTHYFEMFRYMTDEEPVLVSAWFSDDNLPNPRGPQFKDAAGSIRLETPSGKRFYMDCSSDHGHGMQVTYNCRNGRITIDELDGSMHYVARHPEHRSQPTTRYGMPYDKGNRTIAPADAVAPTRAVLESLLKGEDFPNGQDGLLAMKLLIAAHISNSRGGVTIDLRNEDLPSDLALPIA